MAYSDTILASTPLRYWPLNETSGTAAAELVASETATAVGMVMGGADAPVGIGGKCPDFTGGTEHIVLRANKLLGGSAAWTIEAWVKYVPTSGTDATQRAFYSETGTAGNDWVRGMVAAGTSSQLLHTYGDDGAVVSKTSSTVFISGAWVLLTFTRTGATVETWWNAGRRNVWTDSRSSSTWTNTGIQAWVGGTPRGSTNNWRGQVAHVAVYDRVLTQSEILSHYNAGTVLTRALPNRNWWHPTRAVWNQRLDDVSNPPTIASGSAATVTKLANQATQYGASTNVGGGTFYTSDNTTPLQRVRIMGGQNNVSFNPPDLYNALGNVPIPAGTITVGTGTDQEVQIYNSDSDELFEFWVMQKDVMLKPEYFTAVASGSGSLPASSPIYVVAGALADGSVGIRTTGLQVTVNGSQGVRLNWGTAEGAVNYKVYRASGTGQLLLRIATLDASVHTYLDTGGAGSTPDYNSETPAVLLGWGCNYGGYVNATDDSIGVYEPPHQNWGASATSLPLWGGTISIIEAQATVTNVNAIQHAVAMAMAEVVATSHVYPAQRNDGSGGANAIQEGTRFQLDPAFNINTISNPFARAVAKAFQVYGGYVRDVAGAMTGAYVEDSRGLGRDPYAYAFQGLQGYEVFTGFPWSSMRVIDPAWTLTQTLPPPKNLNTLTDNFNTNVIDPNKWASWSGTTATGGQLRLTYSGGSYVSIKSIGGGGAIIPFTLVSSELKAHIVQAGSGAGDQASMRVASQIDLAHCRVDMLESEGALFAQYTNSSFVTVTVFTAPYVPATHAWWKISESGGNIFWWTSPDGLTWTQFATVPWANTGWPSANLANVVAQFVFGNFNGTTGRPDFVIDDLNLAPTIPPVTLTGPPTSIVEVGYPWGLESRASAVGVVDEINRFSSVVTVA